MKYQIVKRYGHEEGLSCIFKQFRAPETHCSKLHGYALAFEFCFEGDQLDHRNWLISFGELKPLKQWLKDMFDHKTCVSIQDPDLGIMMEMERQNILQITLVPEVGCEMFAKLAYIYVCENILTSVDIKSRGVRLKYVQVQEHAGNTAIYAPPKNDDNKQEFTLWQRILKKII